MGYPMTWKRLVKRNGLDDGDYARLGYRWAKQVGTNPISPVDGSDHTDALFPVVVARVNEYEAQLKMLMGDLRRLENDAVDERGLCRHIADRTGVNPEIVAVVLKEFMDW